MDPKTGFDAYHTWLGIPPSAQPPTLYKLLGVEPYESDPDVIDSAADRQMAYLRTLQTGANGPHATRLLNEVSAARACLLHDAQRANYDAVLRSANPAEKSIPSVQPATGSQSSSAPLSGPFAEFDILELTRQSPFGSVYKARHRESGRFVSLKVLPAAGNPSNEVIKRFEREQKITTSLSHPNVIAGYTAGTFQGNRYLVTEYLVGTDLATLVAQQGPLPVDVAIGYILQAARGLTQLHMHGIYHRNIKPHLLFVDMQGQLRVTSLFLARIDEFASLGGNEEDLTQMGQTMGTVEYMAPEQAVDAKSADGRADIYGLGCTLCLLLTGAPPYQGKNMMQKLAAHRTAPIPSLCELRPETPARIDAIFQRMLAKAPDGRYQFMGDVVTALENPEPQSLVARLLGWFGLGKK